MSVIYRHLSIKHLLSTIYLLFIDTSINVSIHISTEQHSAVSDSLRPHGLFRPWDSSGQNTGVGSLSLLQGIFSTQGLNPGLPHSRQILYPLSHKGSPRILDWVAYPFSSRSSQSRNRTGVTCIAGKFFSNWAIREAPLKSFLNCFNLSFDKGYSQSRNDA